MRHMEEVKENVSKWKNTKSVSLANETMELLARIFEDGED